MAYFKDVWQKRLRFPLQEENKISQNPERKGAVPLRKAMAKANKKTKNFQTKKKQIKAQN